MKRLNEEQRALLPRLAFFEGGASEDDLLAITEIPAIEWAKLRIKLEQAALLTEEQLHEDIAAPFLHFHPVLIPFLRSQVNTTEDPALRERYVQRYLILARYLYNQDAINPKPVRMLMQQELPNLQHALELLLQDGNLEDASDMAESITRFQNFFGLSRERDELRRRVAKAVGHKGSRLDGTLTQAEYLRESGLGEDEYVKGNLRAAYDRFNSLLTRIEALPEGTRLGRGSYEHCLTLGLLARCLRASEQLVPAETRLREALTVIDKLIEQQPDNRNFIRQRGTLLADFGDVLRAQGRYLQAQQAYQEGLIVARQQGDLRSQTVALGQQGMLALEQGDYAEAQSCYIAALDLFHAMGEPVSEAVVWHQLGAVAEKQNEWGEAERFYRESLAINEQLGNEAGAARTCNQLALVSVATGRLAEADGWWKRALEIGERVYPKSSSQATQFNNLAALLVSAVKADREPRARLAEAERYAQKALAIKENRDGSSEIWTTLHILAEIADLAGRTEAAQKYRRRERETFAAFVGNRYHIDQQFGHFIAAIAVAAQGDEYTRKQIEEVLLPEYERKGWHITDAIHRIWKGERDWHRLAEYLDAQDALLVLCVLETITQSSDIQASGVQDSASEQIFASLPRTIREALERSDSESLKLALEALSPEELQTITTAISSLQARQEQEFEPLLQAIAAVADGDTTQRGKIEEVLSTLEKKGWHLKEVIQRIWAGERDVKTLTAGLDTQDGALVRRVLAMIV